MAKKQNNRKQPWSVPLIERESLYNGINPSADFGIGSFISQGIGYLEGFRTGQEMSEDEANKEIMKRKNKHSLGGWFKNTTGKLSNWNTNVTNNLMGSKFGQGLGNLGIKSGSLGGIANIGATAVGGLLAGKNKTGVGSAMQTVGSLASNIPGVGGLIGAGVNMVGGLVNAAFGSNINEEFVNQTEAQARQQSNYLSGASDNTSLLSDWNALTFLGDVNKSDVGSDGWFSNKAGRETDRLNTLIDEANARALASITNTAENIDKQNDLMMLANYTAYGGPLNMEYTGVMSPFGNQFKDGGIFIKPSKRGTFTAAAKKRGMGVQEFASKVLANKENYSPAMVKKANFAKNASKWKHADGGPLEELMDSYANPKTTTGILGKGAIQLLDPTGISSYPDVYASGKELWEDLSWENTKDFGINLIGALPLIGKVTAPFKAAKMAKMLTRVGDVNTLVKSIDKANEVNKIIDTVPEILPITRKAVERVQDLTTKIISDPLFDYYSAINKVDKVKDYVKANAAVNAVNIANNTSDVEGIIGDFINKKAEGGNLFTNGVTMIGNGGTHEQNPMEGVPMGIDNQGIPNLVEEGEVIYKDYVFSNRLRVPKAIRQKYKLRGNKELTFADAAKQMQKESEERPNDPISKRGLESNMLRLQQEQEAVREEKQASQEGRQYAHGGKMGILFDGLGEDSNWLYTPFGSPTREDVLMEMEETYPFLKREELSIAPIVRGAGISDTNTGTNSKSSRNLSWLRYAPVVGAAIGLGQNLLSKPDYSNANAILAAAEKAGTYTPVKYNPIGNYLTYTPFDRDYYINKLNANTAAGRRAVMNTSGGNRAAAMAGILATDYNYGNQLGDLARKAEEYNLAQRQAVETFNRATNMANAEMGLKAAMANQEAALNAGRTRLSGTTQAMTMRDEIAARRGASMSANLTNLFDSLGNIGIDEMNRADRDMLIRAGVFGTLSEKPQGWSNKRWEDYNKTISGKGYSRGGQLKKKRGGFTY